MALVSYDNSDSDSEINFETEVEKDVSQKSDVRRRVKIAIPHLSNINTDKDEPSKKIIKPNHNMSSGLFNILPSPIHTAVNISHKFDAAIVKQKNLVPRTVKTRKENKADDTEEEICNSNYFCFDENSKIKRKHTLDSLNIKVNSTTTEKDISIKTNAYFSNLISKVDKKSTPKHEEFESNSVDKIIDINSCEFKKDWKRNAIKEQTVSSEKKEEQEEPSIVSKKKHQITYLAYQAKKNEEKIKEQWAQNRMTRKQTQARYGF